VATATEMEAVAQSERRLTAIQPSQFRPLVPSLANLKYSCGGVVGIATGYWLDDRGVGVRVP
jgi:hypothetical protein